MNLFAHLAWRFVVVALLCLAGAAAWIVYDIDTSLRDEAIASAERTAQQLGRQPGLGSTDGTQALAAASTVQNPTVLTILPGICVAITLGNERSRRLCSGWDGIGLSVPSWFRSVFLGASDALVPISRSIEFRGRSIGRVDAWPEREAAAIRVWRQVRAVSITAAGMALAIGILCGLAAIQSLAPVRLIIRSLQTFEAGAGNTRLPPFATREFDRMATAFNAMAERIAHGHSERAALTLRLFQVQEEERRLLGRDLHDAFGQHLTAVGALAEAIELDAPAERPDLAADARAIARIAQEMSQILRSALARLEPPELEEFGFEGSLRTLITGWQVHRRRAAFHLDIEGDLAGIPPHVALALYRIAQEFLTNATRHGHPTRIFVRVQRAEGCGGPVTLIVDDDGGGNLASLCETPGRGLLGIRERIAALGGSLSLAGSGSGIRACAVIPTVGT